MFGAVGNADGKDSRGIRRPQEVRCRLDLAHRGLERREVRGARSREELLTVARLGDDRPQPGRVSRLLTGGEHRDERRCFACELRLFLLEREHARHARRDLWVVQVPCDFLSELEDVVVDRQEQERWRHNVEFGAFDPFAVPRRAGPGRRRPSPVRSRPMLRCPRCGSAASAARKRWTASSVSLRAVAIGTEPSWFGAHVPLVHDGFALERAAHGRAGSSAAASSPPYCSWAAERREPVAEARPCDHDEREERHEEDE